jgi:hypothetical protein
MVLLKTLDHIILSIIFWMFADLNNLFMTTINNKNIIMPIIARTDNSKSIMICIKTFALEKTYSSSQTLTYGFSSILKKLMLLVNFIMELAGKGIRMFTIKVVELKICIMLYRFHTRDMLKLLKSMKQNGTNKVRIMLF